MKINQMFVRLIFIICAISLNVKGGTKEAFAHLRQNRHTINNAIAMCTPSLNFCPFYELNNMKATLNASVVKDHSDIQNAVSIYVDFIETMSYLLNNTKTDVLSDSISILFLLKLIDGCTERNELEYGRAHYAAQLLRDRASYASLNANRERIRTAITNSCIDPPIRNAILTLINPSEAEKQEMVKSRMLTTPFFARVGDTTAIKFIRDRYNNSIYYGDKKIAIDHIFLSGQPELIKMVVSDFNNPIYNVFEYDDAPPCTSRSTQYGILDWIKRIYPDEKLLNEDFIEIMYIRDKAISSERTKYYLELVTKWLEEKFEVTISDKPKAFIIRRFFNGCRLN